MNLRHASLLAVTFWSALVCFATAQGPPYDTAPPAEPPYYRVRYDASPKEGELRFAVQYTVWIPEGVKSLRGVIVHQHGCGPGSCQSGLTGAYDLHWQALASKHSCALLAASYEQPDKDDCRLWCDPRNGSGQAFQRSLVDLGRMSGHAELSIVPWALWGHSGGGFWSGGMTLMYPERVAAAFLRSGVPPFEEDPDRPDTKPFELAKSVFDVPIMVNVGTEEGFSVTEGRFAKVWPSAKSFFQKLREQNGLVGVSVDPLTGHQCGNQRYYAIQWLDECLTHRLPNRPGENPLPMPREAGWLGDIETKAIAGSSQIATRLSWLPNERIARTWLHYIRDTEIPDESPPLSPTNVKLCDGELAWEAVADLESGIRQFLILRDGEVVATVPDPPKNPFGRPLFQGLLYSDTPTRPLQQMRWAVSGAGDGDVYQVVTENTVGLRSEPTTAIAVEGGAIETTDQPAHLFILSGQSNMGGLKPEESFTPAVQKEFGTDQVIVHKLAVGGQPIRRWDKGWTLGRGDNPKQIGDLYESLISGVKEAAANRRLRSVTFVWMQGEKDARESHGDVYAASFRRILDQLRNDLERKEINFVIGRLSDFGMENKAYPDWKKMRQVLVELAESSPRGAWVNTDDLNDGLNRRGKPIKDDLHYSAEGYITFGKRLAESGIKLVQEHSGDAVTVISSNAQTSK
ncbi:MAG: sialate O-acetylesterase [Planctomycetota bacterium]